MEKKNQHYSSQFPDVGVKVFTVPVSLRRHLYLFKTVTGVFSYKKLDLGTKVFIEHMILPKKEGYLLDLGCGYGAIGIVLAYLNPQSSVYLIDTNRRALWCTRENIKYNLSERSGKVTVFHGNYFKPLQNKNIKFDAIYMNPPLRNGRKEFLALCKEIPLFLKRNGQFQFVIKKKMGANSIYNYLIQNLSSLYEKISVTFKRSGYWIFSLVSI
ncbi:MAG: class I SAM-dependent methyltransferase [Candidatus Lokiarchaeota archaeon]|nr:class I SAM-dependent methyltransferase [Candidatus Lokiarchaeota archaeon]